LAQNRRQRHSANLEHLSRCRLCLGADQVSLAAEHHLLEVRAIVLRLPVPADFLAATALSARSIPSSRHSRSTISAGPILREVLVLVSFLLCAPMTPSFFAKRCFAPPSRAER